jgi:hypothetical protein
VRSRPRRPQGKQKRTYFIRRESHVDGSQWFNDEGRRIYFDKAVWASWLLPNFDSDQNAKVVMAPVLETDVSYRDFLKEVLPEDTSVEEYLQAIQRTMIDRRRGKGPSGRQARNFLDRMRQQAAR